MTTRLRPRLALGACLLLLVAGVAGPASAARKAACVERVLVLSAMPLELNPLVEQAALTDRVEHEGHSFYSGRLAGVDVVLAMTGIGPANAAATTEAALGLPGCRFRAVLFSGVAGSQGNIGDVAVPRRWTLDDGKHWASVDPALLRVARTLQPRKVGLTQDVPVGDAACACPGVDAATPVHLPKQVTLRVGGEGTTSDPFGGYAVPCLPGGGDIAGCEPCLSMPGTVNNTFRFAERAPSLADPGFFQALFRNEGTSSYKADANDQETAAVLKVTHRHGVPFLGIRGVSDGQGDPLNLPGFPVQFAYYRQLAADNSAAVTVALLEAWNAAGRPVAQSR
jgi:nucleoside phosphorylase